MNLKLDEYNKKIIKTYLKTEEDKENIEKTIQKAKEIEQKIDFKKYNNFNPNEFKIINDSIEKNLI